MKVTKVCCQGCGADLQIDETIRFVTCNYCNARLEVVHDTTVMHTRQLDKIEKTTDQLANKVKILELQNDLERLDREWDKLQQSFLARDENGNTSQPSAVGSIFGGVVMICAGIIFIAVTGSMNAPVFLPFGLVIIGIAIFMMIKGTSEAQDYQFQLERYEARRQQISNRIAKEQNS